MAATGSHSTVSARSADSQLLLEQRLYRIGYQSRKALPIKRNDGEPLTRADIQFDLLEAIFTDNHKVFTSHNPSHAGQSVKLAFAELYTAAIYNSTKCSKVLKEKMVETPAFATELAKLSLLTNVGRINTTMAFFPEMKTALRTYHPVPALQKTDGNAQDAPRIKNCLKAAVLPSEYRVAPPSTPEEIQEKSKGGKCPSTSVVNLVFVLANHAAPLAPVHFDENTNFLDLFLPKNLSSVDRARAFLWHIFHYLEPPDTPNPFADDYARENPGKAPLIRTLSPSELALENLDTKEEVEWGQRMTRERNMFLKKLVNEMEGDKKTTNAHFVSSTPEASSQSVLSRSRVMRRGGGGVELASTEEPPFMYYVPQSKTPPKGNTPQPHMQTRTQTQKQVPSQQQPRRLSPYPPQTQPRHPGVKPRKSATGNGMAEPYLPRSSFVQHAWHMMVTSDPSDEEYGPIRHDYSHRLKVLNKIRGQGRFGRLPSP